MILTHAQVSTDFVRILKECPWFLPNQKFGGALAPVKLCKKRKAVNSWNSERRATSPNRNISATLVRPRDHDVPGKIDDASLDG